MIGLNKKTAFFFWFSILACSPASEQIFQPAPPSIQQTESIRQDSATPISNNDGDSDDFDRTDVAPQDPGGITTIDLPNMQDPGGITTVDLPNEDVQPTASGIFFLNLEDTGMLIKTRGKKNNFYQVTNGEILPAFMNASPDSVLIRDYILGPQGSMLVITDQPIEITPDETCQVFFHNRLTNMSNCLLEESQMSDSALFDAHGNIYFSVKNDNNTQTLLYRDAQSPGSMTKLFSASKITQWQVNSQGGGFAIVKNQGEMNLIKFSLEEPHYENFLKLSGSPVYFSRLGKNKIFLRQRSQYNLISLDKYGNFKSNNVIKEFSGKKIVQALANSRGTAYFRTDSAIFFLELKSSGKNNSLQPNLQKKKNITTGFEKIQFFTIIWDQLFVAGLVDGGTYSLIKINTLNNTITNLYESLYPITQAQPVEGSAKDASYLISTETENQTGIILQLGRIKISLLGELPDKIEKFDVLDDPVTFE